MRPPKIIKPYVKAFARQVIRINGDVDLCYIDCTPLQGIPAGECFPIVEEHAKANGGKGVLGWAIWERPKVFIEAEFHMVWETADKTLKDIATHQVPTRRILFLRDPIRRYDGRQVDNMRKALTNDKDVKYFLSLFHQKHALMNEGELANQHGIIPMTPKMMRVEDEINTYAMKINQRYGMWTPER